MTATSYIELSTSALQSNLAFIDNLLGEQVELISVVKGNAYGHGIDPFATMLSRCGVNRFAVYSAQEAWDLYNTGIEFERLIIMGAIADEDLPAIIEKGFEFYVYNFERLDLISRNANKKHRAKIHLELETGMNRTGFAKSDWERLTEWINDNRELVEVCGICSHLAGAEDISNYVRIKEQINNFDVGLKQFADKNIRPKAHLACSAAFINYPHTAHNMVRLGILQYGFWPSKETKMAYFAKMKDLADPLKRVISWKSQIIDLKDVDAGQFIGYGRSYLSEAPMKTALIPVGYSSGFSRSLSNLGKVLINGVRINLIGTINMNMIIADVTNLEHVSMGDEVVLIGRQGDQEISVASFSDLTFQLNYELLTRLPASIPRKIVD